jgi:transcriptional regulator of acetoin/glycerol metabolism
MKQAKPENIYDTLNLEDIERLAIRKALEQANGNMKLASELLGITRYALYRKIDKHGI